MEPKRIFDILDILCKNYPKDDIFSKKVNGKWEGVSTQEYKEKSHTLASALIETGLKPQDKIIAVTNNCPEWNMLDMGCCLANLIFVPIYSTLSTDEFKFIFNHSDANVICVGNSSILNKIEDAYLSLETKPKLVIIHDNLTPEQKEKFKDLISFEELLQTGISSYNRNVKTIDKNKELIHESEVCTIIYTSGTTGTPKGVMLTHKNLLFNAIGHARKQIKDHTCRMLSFLPLCHIYERSMNYDYQYLGISTYYAESLSTIAADLNSCKADGFCAVPRVLEQMFSRLESAGKELSGVKRLIYSWAFNFGRNYDNQNKNSFYKFKRDIADKLIYSKWRAKLGGKEMLVVSGGSAIRAEIIKLFNAAKLYIFEGYGMTEASPVIAVNDPAGGINVIGTVGKPMDGTELMIADDGEILTRGPHIMKGYYKDPEHTNEIIDKDGWLHTGDIGVMVDGKYLKITDRKKEIFKLSLGKYISPQVIENKLKETLYIENCIVVGANQKFATALIIPNFEKMKIWATKNKLNITSNDELIQNKMVINKINKEINEINKTLAAFEQIKREVLINDEWSVANGMLSQTLKLKRNNITKKYKEVIDNIYN